MESQLISNIVNNKIGKKFQTKTGYCTIIEYFNAQNCTIKFDDETIINNIQFGHIKRGNIKNPNFPSVFNKGYVGYGNFSNKKHINIYIIWQSMLRRCYDEKYILKRQTYKDCYVCDEWLNFQVFAKWFELQKLNNYHEGFVLDKDILIKGNKIYSPETCCFVPVEINNLFLKSNKNRGKYPIGVHLHRNKYQVVISKFGKLCYFGSYLTINEAFVIYKYNKEQIIKEVANIWKNKITSEVYEALLNYKIEITD